MRLLLNFIYRTHSSFFISVLLSVILDVGPYQCQVLVHPYLFAGGGVKQERALLPLTQDETSQTYKKEKQESEM